MFSIIPEGDTTTVHCQLSPGAKPVRFRFIILRGRSCPGGGPPRPDSGIIEENNKKIKSKMGGKALPVTFSRNLGRFNNFRWLFLYTLHG